MSGDIQLAFARQPSYFAATAIDGHYVQVVTARDKRTGRIVGMGSRSVFQAYVNGTSTDVGYLSGLRLLPEYRSRAGLVARGFRMFRELHADLRVAYYLTTIAADNHAALSVLTSQRAGLPIYHPWGQYHTLTFAARTGTAPTTTSGVSLRFATSDDADAIAKFLQEQGPRRQFFPVLGEQEFAGHPPRLKGLDSKSILLAWTDRQLVGTLGIWNQSAFKQALVTAYSRRLSLVRPLYNAMAGLRGKPGLPPAGQPMNVRYAAVPVVRPDYSSVASDLVRRAAASLRQSQADLLLLGLHERDPLLPQLRLLSGREYVTLMYLVYWPDETPDIDQLATRVPYLELGCL